MSGGTPDQVHGLTGTLPRNPHEPVGLIEILPVAQDIAHEGHGDRIRRRPFADQVQVARGWGRETVRFDRRGDARAGLIEILLAGDPPVPVYVQGQDGKPLLYVQAL